MAVIDEANAGGYVVANVRTAPTGTAPSQLVFWTAPHDQTRRRAAAPWHYRMRIPVGIYSFVVGKEFPLVVPVGAAPLAVRTLHVGADVLQAFTGKPAPEITATDLGGRTVRLADYRGRVVVLDFWGTWCIACVEALPTLSALQEKYQRSPLVILALHDVTAHDSAEFASKFAPIRAGAAFGGHDLRLPVLLDRPRAGYEHTPLDDRTSDQGHTVHAYGITGFPTTFVIDPSGTVVGHYTAGTLERVLQDELRKIGGGDTVARALPLDSPR